MTVSVSTRLSPLYIGNNVAVRFDFTFLAFSQEGETGVTVRLKTETGFQDADKNLYNVVFDEDNSFGYVEFLTPPSPLTFFYIAGLTPTDQLLDITNYDNFYPEAIERALDKLTAILQEWSTQLTQESEIRKVNDAELEQFVKDYVGSVLSINNPEAITSVLADLVKTSVGGTEYNQQEFNEFLVDFINTRYPDINDFIAQTQEAFDAFKVQTQTDIESFKSQAQIEITSAIDTIQPAVDSAVTNAGNMIGAANKAALDLIIDKPINQNAMLDNGDIYRWNGTAWVSTGLNYVNLSKTYTDTRIGELINSPPIDIFNSINKVTGSYINKSGVQTSSASWSCSGFLPVKYRDVIIYNASANNVVAFIAAYDADRNFLRELVSTSSGTIVVLSGQKEIETDVKFIRVSFYTASSTTYSFQHKPFEFETDMLSKSETSDMVYKQLTAPVNLFDPTLAKDGYALINNVETVTTGWLVSDYIPVISNETYTANGSGYKDPANRTGVHYFDASKVLINTTDTAQQANVPFSVPNTAKFMRINFVKASSPTTSNIIVSQGMVATKSGRLEDLIEAVAGRGGTANRYSGKTLMTFGDSITDHSSTAFTYPPIVADYFGMTLFDPAMSGSRVRSCFYSRPSLASNANILASHLITIAHGTNDFKLGTPLGVITDTPTARATLDDATYNSTTNTTGTFCADYKGVIESILTINPNARIMLITPIRRTQTPGEGANSLGHTLLDYVNAIKDIAKLYSLPILDNHSSSGFNLKTIPTWTSDGLHPTEWAQRNVMAQKIIGFIESN